MGGVVNAAAYAGGHKVRDISVSEIGDVLRHLGGSDEPCSLEKGPDSMGLLS